MPPAAVDIGRQVCSLATLHSDGSTMLHLPRYGLAWEEAEDAWAPKLEAELPDVDTDFGPLRKLVPNGAPAYLFYGQVGAPLQEVLRCQVQEWGPLRTDSLTFKIIAYDPLHNLLGHSIDAIWPEGVTGQTIIQDLAAKYNLPLGVVQGPTTPLTAKVIRGDTVAKLLQDVFRETLGKGGGMWFPRTNLGAIDVIQPGQNKEVYWFRAGESAGVSEVGPQSIRELVTRVSVVGKTEDEAVGLSPVHLTVDGLVEYGIREHIVYAEETDTEAAFELLAQQVLLERGLPEEPRSLVALDVPIRKWDKVRVTTKLLDGYFLVASVGHSPHAGTCTLKLTTPEAIDKQTKAIALELSLAAMRPPPGAGAGGKGGTGTGVDINNISGPVTDVQRYALAVAAGWSGQDAITAVAISIAENGSGDPAALSSTMDIGLWQVNQLWWAQFGGRAEMEKPMPNARAAYQIYRQQGWNAWTTYKGGQYKAYLKRAEAAANAAKTQATASKTAGHAIVRQATSGSYWTSGGTHGGYPAADIFAPAGTPIYAPVGGLSSPGYFPLGGNTTTLKGEDGRYYYFAHAQTAMVGGQVTQGQQIGKVGNTGNAASTAAHVHFAIASSPGVFGQRNGSGDISGDSSYWQVA